MWGGEILKTHNCRVPVRFICWGSERSWFTFVREGLIVSTPATWWRRVSEVVLRRAIEKQLVIRCGLCDSLLTDHARQCSACGTQSKWNCNLGKAKDHTTSSMQSPAVHSVMLAYNWQHSTVGFQFMAKRLSAKRRVSHVTYAHLYSG